MKISDNKGIQRDEEVEMDKLKASPLKMVSVLLLISGLSFLYILLWNFLLTP